MTAPGWRTLQVLISEATLRGIVVPYAIRMNYEKTKAYIDRYPKDLLDQEQIDIPNTGNDLLVYPHLPKRIHTFSDANIWRNFGFIKALYYESRESLIEQILEILDFKHDVDQSFVSKHDLKNANATFLCRLALVSDGELYDLAVERLKDIQRKKNMLIEFDHYTQLNDDIRVTLKLSPYLTAE